MAPNSNPKNPLALIVEDDRLLANIFSKALETAGFETEIIPDGDVAITRLASATPAVVVLDLHLPSTPGGEVLAQIRSQDRLSQVRVIIATADPGMVNLLKAEADLVLIKPISFVQLRDLAARLYSAEAGG